MEIRRAARALTAASVVAYAGACRIEPAPRGDAEAAAPPYQITATVEDIMRSLVDPPADAVWDAVVTEVTAAGVTEHAPSTEEDWAALRRSAIALVESTNLLLMPGRRIAAEGSRSDLPGVDLEPEQIEALRAGNPGAWTQFVSGLHASALTVLDAVDRQDVEALLVAGDGLDLACENCHTTFWYPSLADSTAESDSRPGA
ncbi:MAG: hypothetical protein FJ207_11485 [Gemmatimonadetes bacterium]|nr:hypothetical protein [Gemmatimonadota bacterium]